MGGSLASLWYVDSGQFVAVVPSDAAVNTQPQLVVQRGNTIGVPSSILIASTHPAVMTKDSSGRGQALIYSAGVLADSAKPAKGGDAVVIYCTGLGATGADGTASRTPAVSIGGQPAQVTYAGAAPSQDFPPAGAPALLGR